VITIDRTSDRVTVIRFRFPRTRRERGAAAVEMAIVMPLLVAMLIGIIDFSRIFNAELQLSQAAREGVRLAALGFPTTDAQGRATAAAPNPAWGAALPMGSVTVSACPTSSPTDSYATAAVIVNYTFNGIMWMNGSVLSQRAVMRCAG
jgi:Flp pilus assembly protein TadG